MDSVKFSCVVTPSNAAVPLGCEIWLDDLCVLNAEHVNTVTNVAHEFDDTDGEHVLRIILKNKQPEHTDVDDSGQILSDAWLTISDISFDEIDCTQIITQKSVYRHNFNGTGADNEDQFFDAMGCNGTVELKFSTPIYLWLLENM